MDIQIQEIEKLTTIAWVSGVLLLVVFYCWYNSSKKFKIQLRNRRATDIEIMVSVIMKQVFNLLLATGSDDKVLWKSVGDWQTDMRHATAELSLYGPLAVAEQIMSDAIGNKNVVNLHDDDLDKILTMAERLLVEVGVLKEIPEEDYIEELRYLTNKVHDWRDSIINLVFIQCGVERVVEGTVCEHIDIISTPHRKASNLVRIPIIKEQDNKKSSSDE